MAHVPPDDPDSGLVEAARHGDADAFETLVRRYEARMITLARGLTRNAADAEDLAQEVFVRAYRSLGAFRGDSTFKTWLYRIAINSARSHHARHLLRQPVWGDSGANDDAAFDPPDQAPDPETSLVRREAIERALGDLPDDLREAVTLRDVHGLDYREIAAATGAPIGTVESRIFRARQRLRRALAPLVHSAR